MADAGWSRRSRRSWRRCEGSRRPDRGACDLLADRRAAAAARRELAARAHCALLLLRNEVLLSTCNMIAAGRCWFLSVTNSSVTVHLAQASSLDVLVLVGEVGFGNASWAALKGNPAARGYVACLVFGVGQRVLHVENGLLEWF